MRCIQIDFIDGELLKSYYSNQLAVSYILSDRTVYIGHTVLISHLKERFQNLSFINKVKVVASFQQDISESRKSLDDFIQRHKDYLKQKNIPKCEIVDKKKADKVMDNILNDWIASIDHCVKENGFHILKNLSEENVFGFVIHQNPKQEQHEKLYSGFIWSFQDELIFKSPKHFEERAIWLLAEGFYSEKYFDDDVINTIDCIEDGKPYLINCLKVPNLNLFSAIEIKNIKQHIYGLLTTFRAEADAWAVKCYTSTNAATHFKEQLMPLMATVQEAIDANPLLKQWSNVENVKKSSAIYFGEVSPIVLWKYYKDKYVIPEKFYNNMVEEYQLKEPFTVPVMVFAHKKDTLKLQVEDNENELQQSMVASVRKYMEV